MPTEETPIKLVTAIVTEFLHFAAIPATRAALACHAQRVRAAYKD